MDLVFLYFGILGWAISGTKKVKKTNYETQVKENIFFTDTMVKMNVKS